MCRHATHAEATAAEARQPATAKTSLPQPPLARLGGRVREPDWKTGSLPKLMSHACPPGARQTFANHTHWARLPLSEVAVGHHTRHRWSLSRIPVAPLWLTCVCRRDEIDRAIPPDTSGPRPHALVRGFHSSWDPKVRIRLSAGHIIVIPPNSSPASTGPAQ